MPDLWTICEWAVWAIYEYALLLIPLLRPDPVPYQAPAVWWVYNTYSDWYHHTDSERRPDDYWIRRWLWMCLKSGEYAITSGFKGLIDQAVGGLRTLIGGVPYGFPSLGKWVDFLNRLTGGRVPVWTSNLSAGMDWLRDRLPQPIRDLWQSWDGLFESIRKSVRDWVKGTYDHLVSLGRQAWDWAASQGERVRAWVDGARDWLDRLRADPYGVISGYLGDAWAWLRGFAHSGRDTVLGWLGPDIGAILTFGRDCVRFYYNLWSSGWQLLSDLIADPKRFVLDHVIAEIEKRW